MSKAQNFSKEMKSRIARVVRSMRLIDKQSAIVVSSSSNKSKSRDLNFPFHQDNDFFYLTGSVLENSSLVIFADGRKPVLLAPEISEHQLVWEGVSEDSGKIARRIGAKLLSTNSPLKELKGLLKNVRYLYHPNSPGQHGYEVAKQLLALPSHRRSAKPLFLGHTDHILENLRLVKTPFEISKVQTAVDISERALAGIQDMIKPGVSELAIATRLRHGLEEQGSFESFPAIVASGPNAAVLHHSPSSRRLKAGELLTIDFGGTFEGYAADITRVFPVGDKISPKMQDLYSLLLETQVAIIKKIRPGRLWRELNDQASEMLLKGLRELKILKGSLAKLRKDGAVNKYFPHSLGHSLGIAVHDIGPLRASGETRLTAGMVVTVEPGLYSRKRVAGLPAFGMRIEDDVVVTRSGAKILSKNISKNLWQN